MSLQSRWNGTLRYAALVFPVGLAATRNGREDVTLSTLHRPCNSPLMQLRECPVHGPVPEEETVKAWEAAPGEYVLVEVDELEQAFKPAEERIIDVTQVVNRVDVGPALVRNTWYLVPGPGELPAHYYAIVLDALAAEEAALMVTFPGWGVDQVAAVIPSAGVLLVQKLAAADELHPADAIADRLVIVDVSEQERELARKLVARSVGPLDRSLLVNAKRAAIRRLVEQKRVAGKTVRAEQIHRPGRSTDLAPVPVDLLDALKQSLKQTPARRRRKKAVA
jgi:DNA end-binding protein Ku